MKTQKEEQIYELVDGFYIKKIPMNFCLCKIVKPKDSGVEPYERVYGYYFTLQKAYNYFLDKIPMFYDSPSEIKDILDRIEKLKIKL